MSIRFAPAVGSACYIPALLRGKSLTFWLRRQPANDNTAPPESAAFDPLLVEALQHFARDGLKAAHTAQAAANDSLKKGDRAGFEHWLGLTRYLDRGLARQSERESRNASL